MMKQATDPVSAGGSGINPDQDTNVIGPITYRQWWTMELLDMVNVFNDGVPIDDITWEEYYAGEVNPPPVKQWIDQKIAARVNELAAGTFEDRALLANAQEQLAVLSPAAKKTPWATYLIGGALAFAVLKGMGKGKRRARA